MRNVRGKNDVQQHKIRIFVSKRAQGISAIHGCGHSVSLGFQLQRQCFEKNEIVIDNENFCALSQVLG
jgi:hypothetical protein